MEKIIIENFRGISRYEFEPQKVNIFYAENGKGKTSILQGIRFLFTGKGGSVKEGEEKASVSVLFKDGTSFKREFKDGRQKVYLNGLSTSIKSAETFLEQKLSCKMKVQDALFSGEDLADNKDLSKIFMEILPAQIRKESVMGLANQLHFNPDEKVLFECLPDKQIFTLDDLNKGYKNAYACRRDANSAIRALENLCKSTKMPEETEEELNEKLKKINNAIEKEKEALSAWREGRKKRNDIILRNEMAKSELKKLPEIKEISEDEFSAAGRIKEEAEGGILKAQKEIAEAEAEIRQANKVLSSLSKNVCPISPKLVCTADRKSLADELEDEIRKNEEIKRKAEEKLQDFKDKKRKAEEKIDEYHKNKVLIQKRKTAEAKIMPVEPEKEKPLIHEEYEAMREDVLKKIKETAQYNQVKKANKELVHAEKIRNTYQEVLDVFDPKSGIPTLVLERASKVLEDECSGGRFTIHIEPYPEMQIYAKINGMDVPVSELSSGEKKDVSMQIANALNRGAKFLIIDDLDRLDETRLQEFLDNINEKFDYTFIGITKHGETLNRDTVFEL